jgi:hypothetical protein
MAVQYHYLNVDVKKSDPGTSKGRKCSRVYKEGNDVYTSYAICKGNRWTKL